MLDENALIQTIVKGSDWQEVLMDITIHEGMDPMNIDIVKLTDAFVGYLNAMKTFDFRVPARFVLIAAILLRTKCETLLANEEEKQRIADDIPPLNIDNIPLLEAPMQRRPTRKVTLNELVSALNKAFEFKDKKEARKMRMRRSVETLIEHEEDIEDRIKAIHADIIKVKNTTFSGLVPEWKRSLIVKTLLPILHLANNGDIHVEQPELFKEIYIRHLDEREKAERKKVLQENVSED